MSHFDPQGRTATVHVDERERRDGKNAREQRGMSRAEVGGTMDTSLSLRTPRSHLVISFALSMLLLSAACSAGSGLSESGRRVTFVTSPLDVSGCVRTGEVETDGLADHHDEAAKTAVIHELRNAAADKGGTHVLVREESRDLKVGEVYKCP